MFFPRTVTIRSLWIALAAVLTVIFWTTILFLVRERSLFIAQQEGLVSVTLQKLEQCENGRAVSAVQTDPLGTETCLLSAKTPRVLREWLGDAPAYTEVNGLLVEPGVFRVQKGQTFELHTGCAGIPTINDRITLHSIDISGEHWAISVEIVTTRIWEEPGSLPNRFQPMIDASPTTRLFTVSDTDTNDGGAVGGVKSIPSGTDILVPILLSPTEVFFYRTQVAC